MLYRSIFVFFCFLIISCDLPDEADSDCNGVNLGMVFIDECGRCVGGNTEFVENQDKDCCGRCFGAQNNCDLPCEKCGDLNAINYNSCDWIDSCNINECEECLDLFVSNDDFCIYDLCIDYIPETTTYSCDESENNGSIYQVGDQLHCDDIENPLDLCFPDDCANELSLSDLYGKVIWIEMTASW